MKRRPLPVAAALAATAALLLTACGSGDDSSKSNDNIAGADTGETATSAAPSASASGPADRPKITFPEGVENKFEGWKTGHPAKDAVLSDVAQTVNAVDDAILRGDKNSKTLAYYRQGNALVSAQKWVLAWLDEDLTWTGVTRYFKPNVKVADTDTAAVVYCADESKAFNKNRKTGTVDKAPSEESPYVKYSTQLKKSSTGVWQTTEVLSKRGDKTCAS
ncbi:MULTISPECIES: hypothetical protein [Streptomyces]|uniref:Lipoprotein n=1 Tax=Streptomyces koelreuteriae TaxID=2838015 RepID=A0ABX8FRV5_9ACTN|nr:MULTISPECIES: hypothetical protein [Streptomyces]QWB23799.1 hypothetical protein KJK29_15015 [Streptomyces koelreuteriae]UUA06778.1 hypothetical protein NNW98_15085 [Streptomyces koelreuteriae]UUA14407.1 hypothetical protein NNW99_15080 [Streptomyces sp. CRCS-T-1]